MDFTRLHHSWIETIVPRNKHKVNFAEVVGADRACPLRRSSLKWMQQHNIDPRNTTQVPYHCNVRSRCAASASPAGSEPPVPWSLRIGPSLLFRCGIMERHFMSGASAFCVVNDSWIDTSIPGVIQV
jgi:hypothetical protein